MFKSHLVLFQRFVSHVNTLKETKQNNFTQTKHCFAFVLFQFCFCFISVITTALDYSVSAINTQRSSLAPYSLTVAAVMA